VQTGEHQQSTYWQQGQQGIQLEGLDSRLQQLHIATTIIILLRMDLIKGLEH
jgi:hypothetical protein